MAPFMSSGYSPPNSTLSDDSTESVLVGLNIGAASTNTGIPTKLPLFNTLRASGVSDKEQDILRHNLSTQTNDPVKGTSALLKRFAVFVAALVDSKELSFLATICGETGDPKKFVVQANLKDDSRPQPESEVELVLYQKQSDDDCRESDFAISFGTHALVSDKKFSVLVTSSDESNALTIDLACDKESVPEAAATQLLQLLLCYIASTGKQVEQTPSKALSSVMNYPAMSAQPLILPWDEASHPSAPPLVHAAFERRALDHADRPAIDYLSAQYGRMTLSYAEANARVERIAIGLGRLPKEMEWPPVRRAQRVFPIFMAPCPELYLTILAILRAGHAFAPLPIDAPQERIYDILSDLGAPVVLGAGPDRFSASGHLSDPQFYSKLADRLWLDVTNIEEWFEPSSPSLSVEASKEQADVSGQDLAYIYYTSGSTGKPKGVQISHLAATSAISANAAAMSNISAEKDLRWFQLAVPTFDAFILDLFFTLSAGGTICVADRDMTMTDLEGAMNELEVNTTHTVPSLAMTLRPERLDTLRNLICIGEKISGKVVESFAPDFERSSYNTEDYRGKTLINIYGPTEATINVTTYNVTSKTRGTIIGSALPTCSIVVLDDKTFEPVAAGLPGHLAIGGPQLSHGYLNRPVENAKAFVSTKQFGQLYLTGDKARIVWNEQGEQVLECLGRIQDGQVKLNGRRVELEEIDSVLAKSDAVIEAAVVTVETPGGIQLYACIVPKPDQTGAQAEDACRKAAETNLPRWMNPHHYFTFAKLTRNVSGKIDRTSLRKSAEEIFASRTATKNNATVADATKLPSQVVKLDAIADKDLPLILCGLIEDCVNVSTLEITPTTSLFALGFDSLRAIVFLQKARDVGIHNLGIQDILKGPCPNELARLVISRRVAAKRKAQKAGSAVGEPVDADTPYDNPKLQALLDEFKDRWLEACASKLGVSIDEIETVLPTTHIQTRQVANFLTAETNLEPKPWVEHFVYDIPQSIDSHRFQQAVSTALHRHDIHRTIFTLVNDPVSAAAQVVLLPTSSRATIPWSNIYCPHDKTHKNDLFENMVINAQRAADEQMCLERPPLAVSFIQSTTSTRSVMILSLFHALYDGASLALLRQEIMAEYHRKSVPERTSIETLVRMHFGADQKNTMKFWISKLALTPYFVLPGVPGVSSSGDEGKISVRQNPQGSRVSVVTKRSSVVFKDLVKTSMIELLTTPLSVVQAAWALVLLECQQTKDKTRPADEPWSYDITFASSIHGRHDRRSQICMGPVFATIPLCIAGDTSEDGAETNRQMCTIFAHEHAEALEHLQIPCPSLEWARSAIRFDTTLIFQTFGETHGDDPVDFPGFEEGDAWLPAYRGSDFGIAVLIEIMPVACGFMDFRCTFADKSPKYPWLDDEAAMRLLELFEANLVWIMANPDETFDYRRRPME